MNTRIPWWRTTFGEAEAKKIAEAIAAERISQGPVVAEFERRLGEALQVPHVVATTSGSMALLMTMMAAGVGPGDEVIVPNRTWIATAHAPLLLGAKVVLVDVEPDRPIIDVAKIAEKITPKTKAILPVHLNGRAADMRAINRLASARGIAVIEDAAQALGGKTRDGFLGTQSLMGCFSLSVAKIIATGQGGFVVTRDEKIAAKLRSIRTHGVSDIINAIWTRPGFNFRFTDILASIGLVQLDKLAARIERVNTIYRRYVAGLSGLPFLKIIPVDIAAGEVPLYVEVLCSERESLMEWLGREQIDTRPFYPDLDTAAYFENHGEFPHSRKFASGGLYLPSGPDQTLANVDRVIACLHSFATAKSEKSSYSQPCS